MKLPKHSEQHYLPCEFHGAEKLFANKRDANEAKELSAEIQKRLAEVPLIPRSGLEKIGCLMLYDVASSSGHNHLLLHKNNITVSSQQDLKISVFLAGISSLLNRHEDFVKAYKVLIRIFFMKADASLDGIVNMGRSTMEQAANKENTLHIEPIEPRYTFSQLIVTDNTRKEICDTVKLVKNRSKIYKEWGFEKVDHVPHCTINFFGPPGTGKTMSAHILAAELGLKILPLNYADIESKFVGDAPKNLVSAFRIAEQENALLFFDEADSFLGKRITNVNSSSDQAINSLRSQLLILLENTDIVTVFATNLVENYDSAFNSRILKHIKFELPDEAGRNAIIRMMIPDEVPLAQEEKNEDFFKRLAVISEGFSPREIKNAVLNSLISACDLDAAIPADTFVTTFEKARQVMDELKKKAGERKAQLSQKINTALQNGNYKVAENTVEENNETKKMD